MELINKTEFGKMLLHNNFKIFVMHVAALEALFIGIIIYPLQKVQIATLKQNTAITKVLAKYLDFTNVL